VDTDARIVDLEVRSAHQEATIEELTRTLLQLERNVEALRQELTYIKGLLKEAMPAATIPQELETPPPHY